MLTLNQPRNMCWIDPLWSQTRPICVPSRFSRELFGQESKLNSLLHCRRFLRRYFFLPPQIRSLGEHSCLQHQPELSICILHELTDGRTSLRINSVVVLTEIHASADKWVSGHMNETAIIGVEVERIGRLSITKIIANMHKVVQTRSTIKTDDLCKYILIKEQPGKNSTSCKG